MVIFNKIQILSCFSRNNLVTREAARDFMSIIRSQNWKKVEVDFTGVDFISRSFADQYHKEKVDLWKNNGIEVINVNMLDDVYAMFKAVSNTQSSESRSIDMFSPVAFKSRRSLKAFLSSI